MTSNRESSTVSLSRWTIYATIVQLIMVLSGHFNEFIKTNVFAIGGMSISLVFGGLCAMRLARNITQALAHGGIVGGLSAFIGIAVSVIMGDVPPQVLLFGTAGSLVAGLIGGAVFYALGGKRSTRTSTVA